MAKKRKSSRKSRITNHESRKFNFKPWLIGGLALAGFYIIGKNTKGTPADPDYGQVILTTIDTINDYKKVDGVWYARAKGTTAWVLAPADFEQKFAAFTATQV